VIALQYYGTFTTRQSSQAVSLSERNILTISSPRFAANLAFQLLTLGASIVSNGIIQQAQLKGAMALLDWHVMPIVNFPGEVRIPYQLPLTIARPATRDQR